MIPHEREMVTKLKGKPFALVSVSVDETKAVLTKFLADEPMPWTTGGRQRQPAAEDVPVKATDPVPDRREGRDPQEVGRLPGNADLDKAVEELVKEARAGSNRRDSRASRDGSRRRKENDPQITPMTQISSQKRPFVVFWLLICVIGVICGSSAFPAPSDRSRPRLAVSLTGVRFRHDR